jgi:UDP-glucose 4-epimerase
MPPKLGSQRIMVTGATGFIGSRLLARLEVSGAEVHAVSRESPRTGNDAVRWWQADLSDMSTVRNVMAAVSPNVIFHLAGEVTGVRDLRVVQPTFRAGLIGSVNLLVAAGELGCQRIVLAGSMEEPRTLSEVPCSPYAAAKIGQSLYARMCHALFAIPTITLRIFMVYGPAQRDVNKLVPYAIRALLSGQAPRLTSGTREVDWIYVDDVVEAFLAAAQRPGIEGTTLEVGTGVLTSVRSIVERLRDLINPGIALEFGELPDRPLERVDVADVEATWQSLHWRPTVSLTEGLGRTVAWHQAAGRTLTMAEAEMSRRSTGDPGR